VAPDTDHDEKPRDPAWTWTTPQRRVLAVLLLALCPVLAVRYACNRAYVPDPPPARGPRYDEVADKLDPNTADVASLSALPLIGEKRAQDIVAFREARRASTPDRPVFTRPEDLLLIKGFGQASVETLRPYLIFPNSPPATQR
jgi:competence protein ComEA